MQKEFFISSIVTADKAGYEFLVRYLIKELKKDVLSLSIHPSMLE